MLTPPPTATASPENDAPAGAPTYALSPSTPKPGSSPGVKKKPPPVPTADINALLNEALDVEKEEEESHRRARPGSLGGLVLRSRFRIEKKIGRGAQAEVYLARDLVLDRPVAIKVLNEAAAEDPAALDRFLREARLAARVHHAGCIAIFDFGQERGITFMAMEYFKGKTLRERLNKARLDAVTALRIGQQIAEALGAVHQAGIVHRDVKPTNVMIDEHETARLTDFGVAKVTADDGGAASPQGLMVGTMKYMSPEQARGKDTDGRSDIFSLGVVLYEMLAGRAPFGGQLDDLIRRVTEAPPRLPEELGLVEQVRDLVNKCMERKPAARYQSIEPLIADLKAAIALVEQSIPEGLSLDTETTDKFMTAEPSPNPDNVRPPSS
jgi:serine/threonine protein kinase